VHEVIVLVELKKRIQVIEERAAARERLGFAAPPTVAIN
jgi:hypothetical protein